MSVRLRVRAAACDDARGFIRSGGWRKPPIEESFMYQGGCHCGKVRFAVDADLGRVMACNCSICAKHGLVLTFVGADKFRLVSGDRELTDYQFYKKEIHHQFCRCCGVEPFARGTAPDNSEMVAINVRCLDGVDIGALKTTPFDGKSL
jgi:hypothetical protein